MIGKTFAHYRITGKLGSGGMGDVYRAEDTKLKREVAMKVLPEAFARDEERMKRFEREAQVLASLNHPNIAAIYGIEEVDGVRALVLELVEGPTLAELIAAGRIPAEEALRIARQMAVGLLAAHEKSVIHRDLKPANVKLTQEGDVKILDFGLAKALEGETPDVEDSNSPTLSRGATQAGVLLGTAAYMSPEQAKGKPVDRRADVWAFGAVLYEMLTGKRAFAGEDMSETLAFVLTKEPDWTALPSATPDALRKILRLCLSKDAKRRVRDIGDALLLMEDELEAVVPPSTPKATFSPWVAAVVASLLAGALGWSLKPEAPRPLVRSIATPPASEPLNLSANAFDVAITPDGTRIVYTVAMDGGRRLVVRAMEQLEAMPLPGHAANLGGPFVSPDGNWVAYVNGGALWKVSIDGGLPVTVCSIPGGDLRGASWGDDGTIVFASSTGELWRVSSGGGTPVELMKPGLANESYRWPEVLPGSEAVLFTISRGGSLQTAQIALLLLSTGESRVLLTGGSNPRYAPTGHIVYGVSGTLRAVSFDLETLEVTSDPIPILGGVVTKSSGAADFAISRDGSLVYVKGSHGSGTELVWVDRNGQEEALSAPPRNYVFLQLSPDRSRLALAIRDQENDIWIWEFARETLTRLSFDHGVDTHPIWSPDGLRIAYSSGEQDVLVWIAADGTGGPERLAKSAKRLIPYAFSPDGERLVLLDSDFEAHPETRRDLAVLSLKDGGSSAPLLATEFEEGTAAISPGGDYMAYRSNESGQQEIYVRPFPNVKDDRWLVSRDGGLGPVWARDGSELFYRTADGQLMAVPVQLEYGFEFGTPELVLEHPYRTAFIGKTYDVSLDGKRFLMIKEVGVSNAALILVQNWGEELKRLVPPEGTR